MSVIAGGDKQMAEKWSSYTQHHFTGERNSNEGQKKDFILALTEMLRHTKGKTLS